MPRIGGALLVACLAAGCGWPATRPQVPSMNAIAERYVKLVLAIGQHDAAYVDSYYGPPEWKTEAEQRKRTLPEIDQEAQELIAAVGLPPVAANPDDLDVLRQTYLRRQL